MFSCFTLVLSLLRDEEWRPYLHGKHSPSCPMDDGMHYLTDGAWKYIWFGDGTKQLFDLRDDPREMHNLSQLQTQEARLKLWRRRLVEELKDRPEGFSDGEKLVAHCDYRSSLPHAIIGSL